MEKRAPLHLFVIVRFKCLIKCYTKCIFCRKSSMFLFSPREQEEGYPAPISRFMNESSFRAHCLWYVNYDARNIHALICLNSAAKIAD